MVRVSVVAQVQVGCGGVYTEDRPRGYTAAQVGTSEDPGGGGLFASYFFSGEGISAFILVR